MTLYCGVDLHSTNSFVSIIDEQDRPVFEKRLKNAQAEMDRQDMYRHVVINDDLEVAIDRFVAILSGRAG